MELSRLLDQRKNGPFIWRDNVAPGSAILSDGMYAQSCEDFAQRLEIDRLGYAGITTRLLDAFVVFERRIPRDGHDRHMRKMSLPARPMNQSEAVRVAEMDVQEYRFRKGLRCDEYECRFESVSDCRLKTFGFHPVGQKFAKQRIIFDDENAVFHLVPQDWRIVLLLGEASVAAGPAVRRHNHLGTLNHELNQQAGGSEIWAEVIRDPIKTALPVGTP
jgi:hypothetical protein